jgi:hypothetical protein
LSLAPLAETAHVQLIHLLGAMGRTREAIAQYDRCKRVLAAELGAQPSAELQLARMNLSVPRAVETIPPRQTPDAPTDASPDRIEAPPLVGRRGEVAKLEALLRDAAAGADHGAIEIVGESGIGRPACSKSSPTWPSEPAASFPSGTRVRGGDRAPLWTVDRRARSTRLPDLTAATRADLLPLLPELDVASPSIGDRNRLFDAVTRLLSGLAPANATCVIILDDVQWFDEASAALLHFAIRALSRSRVVFACGVRPSELHDHPVAQRLLRSLSREHHLVAIELSPLGASEIGELVRAVAHDVAASACSPRARETFCAEITRARGSERSRCRGASSSWSAIVSSGSAQRVGLSCPGSGSRPKPLGLVERAPMPAADLVTGIEELERRGILRGAASPGGATNTTSRTISSVRPRTVRRWSRASASHLHIARARTWRTRPAPWQRT